jgi:nuclease S1
MTLSRCGQMMVSMLLLIASLWASHVSAWGEKGHRAVALAAYEMLQPQAKQRVDRLLAIKGFDSLADAAVWPDLVRDTKQPEFSHTGPWHYVNLPVSESTFERSRDCPNDCAVSALEQMQAQLKGSDQQQRAEAMAFIVHIVADLHQPLHVGYAHDRGGNDYPLRVGKEDFSLHYYWDVYVLKNTGNARQLAGHLISRLTQPQIKRQQVASVSQWLYESHAITRRIYAHEPKTISESQYQQDQKQALEQLTLAAARLAYLLNNQL